MTSLWQRAGTASHSNPPCTCVTELSQMPIQRLFSQRQLGALLCTTAHLQARVCTITAAWGLPSWVGCRGSTRLQNGSALCVGGDAASFRRLVATQCQQPGDC